MPRKGYDWVMELVLIAVGLRLEVEACSGYLFPLSIIFNLLG